MSQTCTKYVCISLKFSRSMAEELSMLDINSVDTVFISIYLCISIVDSDATKT